MLKISIRIGDQTAEDSEVVTKRVGEIDEDVNISIRAISHSTLSLGGCLEAFNAKVPNTMT
jgi:hypothetical protein